MRRITTILKSADATIVRKAVAAAGASHVALIPINRSAALGDWHCGSFDRTDASHVRIVVTAEDALSDGIFSAILRGAPVGMVECIRVHPRGTNHRQAA